MKGNCRMAMQAGLELITLDGSCLNLLSVDFRAVMLGVLGNRTAETRVETLSYYSFSDSSVGSRFGPTSRARAVGTFPDGQSSLKRISWTASRHIAGSQWSARKSMIRSMRSRPQPSPGEKVRTFSGPKIQETALLPSPHHNHCECKLTWRGR